MDFNKALVFKVRSLYYFVNFLQMFVNVNVDLDLHFPPHQMEKDASISANCKNYCTTFSEYVNKHQQYNIYVLTSSMKKKNP